MPGGQASLGEGARARPPPPAAGATGCGGPGASAGAWEWPCRSAVVTSRHWPPPPRSATGRPASRWLGAALGDQAAGGPRPLRRRRSAAARQPPAASWGGRSRRSALLFWCLFPTVTPGRRRGEQHSGRHHPNQRQRRACAGAPRLLREARPRGSLPSAYRVLLGGFETRPGKATRPAAWEEPPPSATCPQRVCAILAPHWLCHRLPSRGAGRRSLPC